MKTTPQAPTIDAQRPLPQGWRWVRLRDHVRKIGSGLTPLGGQASYLDCGIPLIRSQNVHMNNFVPNGLAFISPEQDECMCESRVQAGDVLLNITGASIGRTCVVPAAVAPANVNQHVCIIRTDGSIDHKFLSLYISTPGFQKYILDTQAGATRQALTKNLIEGFQIPCPPLPEQQRIAAALKEQMATVEKARAAAQARLTAIKSLPVSYLRSVFSNPRVSEYPCRRLSDLADLLPSKSIASDGDGEVQAITTACLSEAGFLPSGVKQARMQRADVPLCTVRPGEVLVARSNTPELVGRVSMYVGDPDCVVASDLTIRLWPRDGVTSEYLSAYLSYLYATGYWKNHAGGASGSMKKITRGQIASIDVPTPPVQEQTDIAKWLSQQMQASTHLSQIVVEELNTINALPAALLRRAFNGEL